MKNHRNNLNEGKNSFAWPLVKLGLGLCLFAVVVGCQTQTPEFKEVGVTPVSKGMGASGGTNDTLEAITLRAGDILQISFPGSPNLDTTQKIRRDGKMTLQLVGDVDAAGMTPEEFQQSLLKLYSPQLTTKEVTVTVQSSSFPVYITGFVIRPGKITSDHPLTALEAIMEAGGFDYAKANLKKVTVIRQENGGTRNFTLNLKLILDGEDSKPFYLQPSDIVYVPERFSPF